jgi:MFS transporter, PAT family, beta-lactamase induction signal transducer AmpG
MTNGQAKNWREALSVYRHPRVIAMLFLGFAAGLPFPLVFATLSAWLRTVGIEKATIGFFAWIGLTYSIKVFWAPVVDRVPLFRITSWLGHRRSWMLFGQLGIVLGLIGMASTDPTQNIMTMALFALLVAFSSATQDISIDAYRIEAVVEELQGAMAATYQGGYRVGLQIVGGAAALHIAGIFTWSISYWVMAVCMLVGVVTVLVIREPDREVSQDTMMREQKVVDYLENSAHVPNVFRIPVAWFIGSVICPFTDFFQRNGYWALFILVFISMYRISDIVLGNMAYPFYIDMGFSLAEIANVAKIYGFLLTIVGAFSGGILVYRIGVLRVLLLGAILVAVTNLLFAQLAMDGKSINGLILVISADNFSAGLASTAFIAYLSQLTNRSYTATQYALFSSLMTLAPKILSGFSGVVVDAYDWVSFFIYASATGIPAILLVLYLMKKEDRFKSGH